jgi:hypothetical protein
VETAEGAKNPDWYPDPVGNHELRYHDGSQWTEHVATGGVVATAPIPAPAPAPAPAPSAGPAPAVSPAVSPAYAGETCQACGRAPATRIVVRRHVGMVILQKFYKANGVLCRDHGRALSNQYLRKTLVEGWWGVTSFFFNFFAVYTDVVALRKSTKLAPPTG